MAMLPRIIAIKLVLLRLKICNYLAARNLGVLCYIGWIGFVVRKFCRHRRRRPLLCCWWLCKLGLCFDRQRTDQAKKEFNWKSNKSFRDISSATALLGRRCYSEAGKTRPLTLCLLRHFWCRAESFVAVIGCCELWRRRCEDKSV